MRNVTKKKKEIMAHLPEKLKQRLYHVVLDLLSQKDFHQVQIREICTLSGLSPSKIYRYFSSKEDLLFNIIDEKIIEIVTLAKFHIQGLESTREFLRKIFWVAMDYYDRNPGVPITAFRRVSSVQRESFVHLSKRKNA